MFIQFITYILLPLVVAYFTTVMNKRKEVQLEAQGQLLEHRIQAYAEIYRFMRQNLLRIAVPHVEETLYADCLEGSKYKIGRQGMEYASYLSSIERIEQYSDQLKHLLLANRLYIEPKLLCELNSLQEWIENYHKLIKAFKATEENPRWNFDADLRRTKVRFACSLLGIALQEDINRFSSNIEPVLEERLRHPRISQWSFKASEEDYDSSFTHSQLATQLPDLIVRLNYLHYSNRFTPNEFDSLPNNQILKYLTEFAQTLQNNLK